MKTARFFYLPLTVIVALAFSRCKDKPVEVQEYRASRNDTTATVSITVAGSHFYGKYKISFVNNGYSGEVRGEKSGDTLIGRFSYPVANGTYKVSPFVLLQRGENLIMASGATGSYLNIPYYDKSSVSFEKNNLIFTRVEPAQSRQ